MTSPRTGAAPAWKRAAAVLSFASLAALAAAGCGGGGGGGGGGGSSGGGATVSGTAATGAPIDGGDVTIKDANGVTRSAVTLADGSYSVDVGGLAPPFLVRVEPPSGPVLFSVGTAAGVVNVTPFTDLIIDAYYDAQGLTLTAQFAQAGAPDVVPTPGEVRTIATIVRRIIGSFLQNEGIDPSTFDLISTPFDADGAGFDGILDDTTIGGDGHVTITHDGASQSATVTADSGSHSIDFDSTTSVGTQTATTHDSTTVVTGAARTDLEVAEEGTRSFLEAVNATVQAHGGSLTGADVLPLFDAGYLDRGRDRFQGADQLAGDLSGQQIEFVSLDQIVFFHAPDVISVIFTIRITKNGQTVVQRVGGDTQGDGLALRKQGNGDWLFFGNQRIASVELRNQSVSFVFNNGGRTDDLEFRAAVHVNENALQGATVTGLIPPDLSTPQAFTLTKNPFGHHAGEDNFEPASNFRPLAAVPPAGSVYTFALAVSPTGSVTSYDFTLGGATSETIDITFVTVKNAATGATIIPRTALASFVASNAASTGAFATTNLLGKRVVLEWTLPATATVASFEASAFVRDASQVQDDSFQDDLLTPTSTSASFVVPTTVGGGGAVKSLQLEVHCDLENGAQIQNNVELKDIP